MSDIKKPTARIKIAPLTASIWRNQRDNGVFYSVEFTRSYRDEAGNWQTSSTYNPSELLLLAHIAGKAYDEIEKLKAEDRKAHKSVDKAA
jgi:hypothetical protein